MLHTHINMQIFSKYMGVYILCSILYKIPKKSIYRSLAYYKHDYF